MYSPMPKFLAIAAGVSLFFLGPAACLASGSANVPQPVNRSITGSESETISATSACNAASACSVACKKLPGGGTTDYAVEMFYAALRGERYTCFVRADTVLPMIYMPDCINAALDLMTADAAGLEHRNGFNLPEDSGK